LYFGKNDAQMSECTCILWIALRDRSPHLGSFPEIAIPFKPESLLSSLRSRYTGKRREYSHESERGIQFVRF
jgi:hypothetical protein